MQESLRSIADVTGCTVEHTQAAIEPTVVASSLASSPSLSPSPLLSLATSLSLPLPLSLSLSASASTT
jgi:hypothetical protein